jgi:hypothetical protein
MAPTALYVKATIPDVSGIAADAVTNGFAFAHGVVADVVTAVSQFYLSANTTAAMSAYFANSRTRVPFACTLQTYDISTFLHGEPHGTPIDTEVFSLLPAFGGFDLPDQVAAVFSYHGILSALPEHGPVATRPTTEAAQDVGAPATHSAKTRPRASLRGRIYFGPLVTDTADAEGQVKSGFEADAFVALHRLKLAAGASWGVWSRTYGTITPVDSGWIDQDFGVVRRRRDRQGLKFTWS